MDEKDQVIEELMRQLEQSNSNNVKMSSALSSSTMQQHDGNFIQQQLETADMLDKLEHYYRGDKIESDGDGNEMWVSPTDDKLILFNEYGVSSMMGVIGLYFNRNTILSQYDDMRINQILFDLGNHLRKFIYCNYEKMGMNTEFKKTRFPLIIINTLHCIESAYRRALNFKTADTINSAKVSANFSQHDPGNMGQMPMRRKGWNPFRPRTW